MADERIDHAAEAESLTDQAFAAMRIGEEPPEALATLALKEATLALVEQQRIANLIALEQVRIERTNAGGNYYGPSVVWENPATEYGSAPLYDDIAIGLGVDRG